MANELRTRTNFVGGLVEDNPLTNVATTLTSAGLAALPVIDTTNHAALILDPDGIHGAPEIVWVTAHSASSTTATILRAQESTSARQHLRDTYWVHTATVADFEQYANALIGETIYHPGSVATPSTTSATPVDVDSINLAVDFRVPNSGNVEVTLHALADVATTNSMSWALGDSSVYIPNTAQRISDSNKQTRPTAHFFVSGLTPGQEHTYTWMFSRDTGGASVFTIYGSNHGPAIMRVFSRP